MDRTERHTNYPNLFRSTSLIHYLLVIFHWNGCLYHIIYKNNGFGSKNWVFSDSETADVVKQYLQSYYWCTLALTTIGDLPRYFFLLPRINFVLHVIAEIRERSLDISARSRTSCCSKDCKKQQRKDKKKKREIAHMHELVFVQTFKSHSLRCYVPPVEVFIAQNFFIRFRKLRIR